MRRVVLMALTAVLGACAGGRFDPADKIQGWFWRMEKKTRKPGEQLLEAPAKIAAQYGCDQKTQPFASIEGHELLPPRVHPGEELNHRLVYVMCPTRDASVVTGELSRRIYYKGKVVFKDVSKGFEMKPGKWSVDAFITVPPQAESGIYSLEVSFSGKPLELQAHHDLVVVGR